MNSYDSPGFPVHILQLKVGPVVMLIQYLIIKEGLCNGIHLQIIKLLKHTVLVKL